MNTQQKFGIMGALAATLGLGVAGLALQAKNSDASPTITFRTDIDFSSAPAVASTHPGGPSSSAGKEAVGVAGKGVPDASSDNTRIAYVVSNLLVNSHYSHHPMDDVMANRFFTLLLDNLDPQHFYFLKSDLEEFEQYRTTVDDLLKDKGDISPAYLIFGRYKERVAQQTEYITGLLKTEKFTFDGDETYLLDRKSAPPPADMEAAKKLWADRLRYDYLQEKLNKQKPEEIVNTLTRRYARIARAIRELDEYDIAERYLDTLANAYDPHTDYLGKSSSEAFNINYIRLSLFGIGAQLQGEDGYTKIIELIPGGPAERGGELQPGDRIVAVAQGKTGEPVDVVDMKLDKVVEMIRGPKGTVVKLTVIPASATDPSTRKTITLVRDQVKIEEQAAKARIIEAPAPGGKTVRIGVVDLPTFYADPSGGKSATEDVAKLLKKLKEQKVAGVILDLRRNGGGLLTEAVSLTGLFIPQGPVVQVKDYRGKIRVEEDEDASVAYDGPLVVLTSRVSASASEIVAGALQDYGRAVVVGEASTYGKGTVQAVLTLSEIMNSKELKTEVNPGSLHLTIQKFYRASGASTQLEGVKPNIILPSTTDALEIGERYMDNPLPWDTITAARYSKNNRVAPYLAELSQRSKTRLQSDQDFQYLTNLVARAKKTVAEKTVSLNEKKRLQEVAEAKARTAARQKALASRGDSGERYYLISVADAQKPGLPKALTAKQLAESAKKRSSAVQEDEENEETNTQEVDFHLKETQRILQDYIALARK